jgi:hypothetical protein
LIQLNGFSKTSVVKPTGHLTKPGHNPQYTLQNSHISPQFGFFTMGPQFDALVKKGLLILGAVAAGSAAIGGGLVYWATQGNHDHPKENPTVQTPTKTDTSKK